MSSRIKREANRVIDMVSDKLYERYMNAVHSKFISRSNVYCLLGVSKQQLSSLENRKFRDISMKNYIKLNVILNKLGVEEDEKTI